MKSDYFTPYVNDDEKLKVTPPRLVASQWKELVKYWKSETTKGIAEKISKIVKKINFIYRKGRIGYAGIRYEMEQNGEDTIRSNVWIKAHMPKLGVQLDPNTEVVVSELHERLADVPEEEMTQEHMDIIFDDVVGKDKRGRIQTFGLGPSKKGVLKKSAQVPIPEIVEKIKGEIREEMKGQFKDYMQANMPTLVQSYLEKIGVSIPSSCIQVHDTSSAHRSLLSGAFTQNLLASRGPHEESTPK